MVPFLRSKLAPLQGWPARSIVGACTVAAIIAPRTVPLLGNATYLIGLTVVVIAAGLTDLITTLAVGAILVLASTLLDHSLGFPLQVTILRAAIFVIMVGLVTFGAAAFQKFLRQADASVAALQRSEALMRAVIETGPDPMLVIDAKGVVLSFSRAAEALFGWSSDEIVGQSAARLLPAPVTPQEDLDVLRPFGPLHGSSKEAAGVRRDGSHFPMVIHVAAVEIDGERRFTAFLHDLTEIRDAHQRTQDLNAQLAHVWGIHSLGEMAAVLAHELNQPLAAIANYASGARAITARMELPDDGLMEALDRVNAQAIRAGEIIRRMRKLVTRKETDRRPESLSAMISEVDFMIDLAARESRTAVQYEFASGPDMVLADRVQGQQVVMNLVRNALEATRGRADAKVLVATAHEDRGWTVRVEDNGPGLDAETAANLFQPMRSEKSEGLGLGLSISRSIVEGHGGAIWTERSRFGGAAFCFMLPAASREMTGA